MEAYAQALLIAIPGFLVLILIEILYGYFKGYQTYGYMDTLSSLSSGMTNILKDSLGLAVILISYSWLVNHIAVYSFESSWPLYVVAFICIDFSAYWGHRLNHHINIFWNQHVIHHSSEEFNLACALRQSISNVIGYNALFLIPAALLGVPSEVINVLSPLHLFAQFWYHTRHIGKLGWLEYLLVTPSQHRVHHAINPIYVDKNLAAIFCVWDRIFGTFQEELDEEPPVYGTLKPSQSWNPFLINFQHFWYLTQDAWRTRNLGDKLKIWWMPTGWRPQDVAEKYPRKPTDWKQQVKYNPPTSTFTKGWAMFQLLGTTFLLLTLFASFGSLSYTSIRDMGMLLFVSVFAYTSIMDGTRYARIILMVYPLLGMLYIYSLGTELYLESPLLYYGALGYWLATWFSNPLLWRYSQPSISQTIDGFQT
jgi:alkylglycerol monooxygenase